MELMNTMSRHTHNGHVQQCVGHRTNPLMMLSMTRNLLNCIFYPKKKFTAYGWTENSEGLLLEVALSSLISFVYHNVGVQMGKMY